MAVAVPPASPTAEDIFLFINPVVYKLRVKPESTVMCMVYLNRLCAAAHFTLDPFSWRWATLSCLALATKVYEDLAIWNADFKEAFTQLSVAELNTLEVRGSYTVQEWGSMSNRRSPAGTTQVPELHGRGQP